MLRSRPMPLPVISPGDPNAPLPALPPDARAAVLAWFDARGRVLAFRATRDPYAILVSEVMAQQTQIARVVEAWSRFLERFPTVADLAAATPADVLRAWQGMGYDRRALNLRRAAQAIVADHGGKVPRRCRCPRAAARDRPVHRARGRRDRVRSAGRRGGHERPAGDRSGARRRRRPGAGLRRGCRRRGRVDRPGPARRLDARGDGRRRDGLQAAQPGLRRLPARDVVPVRGGAASRERGAADPRAPARGAPRARPRPPAIPFPATTRWLRGRIVDRLRAANDETWTAIDDPIGAHAAAAVRSALRALAADGIVELDPQDPSRARLALD